LGDARCLLHSLQGSNDKYLVRHDFASYVQANARAESCFANADAWSRTSIFNCAGAGKFSTDRTIQEYATKIWKLQPAKRPQPEVGTSEDASSISSASSGEA
jgi:starch phosphorylase